MALAQSRTGFQGVYPILYAFFDEAGKLDREAMRRQVINLPRSTPVDYCINRIIKYKINVIN